MYYVFSKLLWFFAAPSNVVLILVVAGALLLGTRWRKAGRRLVGLAALLIVVIGLSPLSAWLLLPLEERFPPWKDDGKPVAAIVVLGGPVEVRSSETHGTLELSDSAERIIAMADLARRYPNLPVVFTGGAGSPVDGNRAEADYVAPHLGELGLAPDRVRFERQSRNTVENARFVKPMLDLKPGDRVLLVTSAFHMPRSVGLFRAEGYEVVPYPVDFRIADSSDLWRPSISVSGGLSRMDLAVREWMGLIAARVFGQSRELFPAP